MTYPVPFTATQSHDNDSVPAEVVTDNTILSLGKSQVNSRNRIRRVIAGLTALVLLSTALVLTAPSAQAQSGALAETPDATWQADGEVHVILAIGNTLYVGGDFSRVSDGNGSSLARNNLAAFNRFTGVPTSFNPNINGKVFALAESSGGSKLFVGGNFTTAKGQNRKRIAEFNLASGALTNFDPPSPNKAVKALTVLGTKLYIGGLFDKVGDTDRLRLAAYNIGAQTLNNSWAPIAGADVKTLIADSNKIWIAGKFGRINNQSAKGLAAVNASTGTLQRTDHPDFQVVDIAIQGNRVLVAGAGRGGQAASYNRTTGAEQWVTSSNGNMQGVAGSTDWAYFGGHHTKVGSVDVGQMTRFNIRTGELDTSWLPYVNGKRGVNAVETVGGNVYIGGDFTFISGERQAGFAAFGSGPVGDAPELNFMRIIDEDKNGYIDTIKAFFDEDLASCSSSCKAGWALTNVPSGGTLRSASTDGPVAILRLNEGSGDADTSVADFKIALSPANNMPGVNGVNPTFAATAPRDGAGPVPVHMRKINAGSNGLAESGDAFQVIWSEPLLASSLPSAPDVIVLDPATGGNDRMKIAGVIDGSINLRSGDFLQCPTGPCGQARQAVFANSPLVLSNQGRVVTITLATCYGNCGMLAAGPTTDLTYRAASTITDLTDKPAVATELDKTLKMF